MKESQPRRRVIFSAWKVCWLKPRNGRKTSLTRSSVWMMSTKPFSTSFNKNFRISGKRKIQKSRDWILRWRSWDRLLKRRLTSSRRPWSSTNKFRLNLKVSCLKPTQSLQPSKTLVSNWQLWRLTKTAWRPASRSYKNSLKAPRPTSIS